MSPSNSPIYRAFSGGGETTADLRKGGSLRLEQKTVNMLPPQQVPVNHFMTAPAEWQLPETAPVGVVSCYRFGTIIGLPTSELPDRRPDVGFVY